MAAAMGSATAWACTCSRTASAGTSLQAAASAGTSLPALASRTTRVRLTSTWRSPRLRGRASHSTRSRFVSHSRRSCCTASNRSKPGTARSSSRCRGRSRFTSRTTRRSPRAARSSTRPSPSSDGATATRPSGPSSTSLPRWLRATAASSASSTWSRRGPPTSSTRSSRRSCASRPSRPSKAPFSPSCATRGGSSTQCARPARIGSGKCSCPWTASPTGQRSTRAATSSARRHATSLRCTSRAAPRLSSRGTTWASACWAATWCASCSPQTRWERRRRS
mmetsp:Transcript_22407/g.38282  ORF Transcript_22407/g.38282 Transcript_22407/m.38282 type:complete len:279 (+) Transcript_22407:176-1012(+)